MDDYSDDYSDCDEELVGNSPSTRNWRGILIALLVILIVLSLIVTAVILVSPTDVDEDLGTPFSFDDLFSNDYKPKKFEAEWMTDDDVFIYRSREGEIMEYDPQFNTTSVLMDNSTLRQYNTDTYFVSPDRRYILIAYDIEYIYRHSFLARYIIFDRNAPTVNSALISFPSTADELRFSWSGRYLQFAGWSKTGHSMTFVYENNIYYQKDPVSTPSMVTRTGVPGKIFNGVPDWVYEEEILHSNKGQWWSPQSTKLCYASFNDTHVPIYQFPYYGTGRDYYSNIDNIAYPKAGDTHSNVNPVVQLYLFDTTAPSSAHKIIRPPHAFRNRDHYLVYVKWIDESRLLIGWMNRRQNHVIVTVCSTHTSECRVNLEERSLGGHGWQELTLPVILPVRNSYATLLPEQDMSHGYWMHIAEVTHPMTREGAKTFLTQGTWDVTELLSYDAVHRHIYYISTNNDPRKRHLFRVGLHDLGSKKKKTPECLTCDMDGCQYVSAQFSASSQFYILHCLGPDVPYYVLKSTQDNRHILLEDNAELKVKLREKAMPVKEYHQVRLPHGHTVHVQLHLPPTLVKKHIIQYPTVVHVYGGPGTQQVTEKFAIDWGTYLASSENFIYVSIDGRGTGARGQTFLHSVHHNLGTIEVDDQIMAARYLQTELEYVDIDRIAMWGWSYGGFVTAHAIGDDRDIFNCGIAVAPVTDWRYYDTVYSERYMGLAEENYQGYDRSNVTRKVVNFKNKNFMLVHGTADDNVHFQNSAHLMKELVEHDIDFRSQIYADKNHGISGRATSRHLYRSMTQFLKHDCWHGGRPLPGPEERPTTSDAASKRR